MQEAHAQPAESSTSRTACALAWALAVVLLGFLCIWPVWSGIVVSNDDLKFLRGATPAVPVADAVRAAWNAPGMFRPLEILVAAGCDPVTLACLPVAPVQAAGLVAFCIGVVALTRRIAPRHPIAAPLVLIWIALSPATTVSLWQMDTCSQTWAAALAIWTGLFTWRGIDAARAGRVDWAGIAALVALFGIGCTIKEIFYGWSAGIGTALVVALVALWRSDRAAARRASLLLVPVVLLPVAHLLVRLKFSGFAAATGTDDRYAVDMGDNLLRNAAVSFAGAFANGPLHLLGDDAASPLLRALPLASVVTALCLFCAALGFRLLHRSTPGAVRMRPLLLVAAAGILSLSVTLPMGSVSELYGFGANVGAGLLVVSAMLSLWFPVAADERLIGRGLTVACAATLLLVGMDGLASRAYHFGLTWQYTRALNDAVLAHQRALPAGARDPVATVFLATPCFFGKSHSQYVVTPLLAVGFYDTGNWINQRDPERQLIFSLDPPLNARPGVDLVLNCGDLPQRAHW